MLTVHEIELCHVQQPEDGSIAVGRADGRLLTYRGRAPFVGNVETTPSAISDALKEAVDRTCNKLWGPEWPAPLAVVGALSRRATSKDRIWKAGLPAATLRLIGCASGHEQPRAFGDLLLFLARLDLDAYEGRSSRLTVEQFLENARTTLTEYRDLRRVARNLRIDETDS